jgi:uncharacterized membrane protein YbhN (UPF0104 family)
VKVESSERRGLSQAGIGDPVITAEAEPVTRLPRPSGYRWLRRIAAFLVISACFFFLGRTLLGNLAQISSHQWQLKPVPLLLSFLLLGANLGVSALVWKMILALFGVQLPFRQSFKIMFVSAPGKYVPGKIWIYLSQVYLSQKSGIPKGVALVSMLLLFAGYVLAGAMVFAFSLFFWEGFSPWLIVGFLLVSLWIFWSLFSGRIRNLLSKLLGLVSKRFSRAVTGERFSFNGGTVDMARILLILLADWTIFAAAAYFLINSFYQMDIQHVIILCGIFAVSVLAGIVSFFVPAGLGVREGVQSYLLSLFIPISAAVLISLAMRAWMILGETGCFLAALRIKRPRLW